MSVWFEVTGKLSIQALPSAGFGKDVLIQSFPAKEFCVGRFFFSARLKFLL